MEDINKRLVFLAEQYDVFEYDHFNDISLAEAKKNEMLENKYDVKEIKTNNGILLALLSSKINLKGRVLKKVSITSNLFSEVIKSDPTKNKVYVQWILTIFSNLIKSDEVNDNIGGVRLVEEDLPQANLYLGLFDSIKKKKKFIDLSKDNFSIRFISDPTNINQYKNLSQLFDAVDPFIEKNPSSLEKIMEMHVNKGNAIIPVKDRKFTLYIPLTRDASVIFSDFASWCTAKVGNGNFNSYTRDNRKPNGEVSNLYVVIDNGFFKGENTNIYQLHFETNQIKDKSNSEELNFYEKVILNSLALDNFFYEELIGMAKESKKPYLENIYLKSLVKFGHTDALFEMIDEEIPVIKIMKNNIPKLPNIKKFKNLDTFIISESNLYELHPSIGDLEKLELLILTNNKLKNIPKEIGKLKKLVFLNICGNKITNIPEEIKYLDKSNGGSLFRIGVRENEIGSENYKKLKSLLPTTIF